MGGECLPLATVPVQAPLECGGLVTRVLAEGHDLELEEAGDVVRYGVDLESSVELMHSDCFWSLVLVHILILQSKISC